MKRCLWIGLGLVACRPETGNLIGALDWEATEGGTVLRAEWTLQEEALAWVEFGPSPRCDRWKTPKERGLSGEVLLIGLPPATDACFSLYAEKDGVVEAGVMQTYRTSSPPAAFEPMEVEIFDDTAYADGFWLGTNAINPALAYVLDRDGNYVWWHKGPANALTPQMSMAHAKDGFVFNEFNRDFSIDESRIVSIGFDGVVKESISTPNGHHSFTNLPDGSLAYLAIDVRDTEEYGPVVGDALIIDDGVTSEVLYTTWDDEHILLEPHEQWGVSFYPQGIDWTHANYLYFDEDRNSFTISFAHADAIVEVDADTGAHLRSIGQAGTHSVPGNLLGRPHSAEWTDDGNLLFFTTPRLGENEESIGVELAFDDSTNSTEVVWSYGEGLNYFTLVMGEVLRLDNGNTLMNFGSKGIVEEISPEGEVVWRMYTATGTFPGHLVFVDSFYEDNR